MLDNKIEGSIAKGLIDNGYIFKCKYLNFETNDRIMEFENDAGMTFEVKIGWKQ